MTENEFENAAIIEGVYDIVLPDVPAARHRWGRKVWFRDIEVGAKGKFIFFENGVYNVTNLSLITDVKQTSDLLEIYTLSRIYKLRILPEPVDKRIL